SAASFSKKSFVPLPVPPFQLPLKLYMKKLNPFKIFYKIALMDHYYQPSIFLFLKNICNKKLNSRHRNT
ncbi:hypothetical protein, partial [Enterococcus raffinosus]|uniref:hypothetical protein n=1 Tax=Enterococcus raffinosus TaxID=71452 RepID=UPI0026724CA4